MKHPLWRRLAHKNLSCAHHFLTQHWTLLWTMVTLQLQPQPLATLRKRESIDFSQAWSPYKPMACRVMMSELWRRTLNCSSSRASLILSAAPSSRNPQKRRPPRRNPSLEPLICQINFKRSKELKSLRIANQPWRAPSQGKRSRSAGRISIARADEQAWSRLKWAKSAMLCPRLKGKTMNKLTMCLRCRCRTLRVTIRSHRHLGL